MDQRIEAFLADVLVLAGEDTNAVRAGVRDALADCEAIFRAQQTNNRMRDNAALVCRALCRSRVVAEMHQCRGTRIAEHLNLVLSITDRQEHRIQPSRTIFAVVVVLLNALSFASLAYVVNRKGQHTMAALAAAGAWLFGVASVWLILVWR